MGKKFEGANLTASDVVDGYVRLGMGNLLGEPGAHTLFEVHHNDVSDTIEVFCLPGNLSGFDVESILVDAGLKARRVASAA